MDIWYLTSHICNVNFMSFCCCCLFSLKLKKRKYLLSDSIVLITSLGIYFLHKLSQFLEDAIGDPDVKYILYFMHIEKNGTYDFYM